MYLRFTNDTLYHPKVFELLESQQKFDVVIVEQLMNEALHVFGYLFDCPLVVLWSMGSSTFVNSMVGNSNPVSYSKHLLTADFRNPLTFFSRATNLALHIAEFLVRKFDIIPKHDALVRQAFPNAPPFNDLYTNVSLVLLNSHTSIYPAVPIVPNMVDIGGYFVDPPKSLPKSLQEFMDNATAGVIYFSMGTNLKSKDMPQERKQLILNVFGKLKEQVLWKFEEDLPNKPPNVVVQKWLPQQDLLGTYVTS